MQSTSPARAALLSLVIVLMAVAAPTRAATPEEDAAWIERYVGNPPPPAAATAASAAGELRFADLARLRGQRVRVLLRDGRERAGVVTAATGAQAQLSVAMAGGRFAFTITPAQVRRIVAE